MKAAVEYSKLLEVIAWVDERASEVTLPADERAQLAIGCFDVALEHQAAIALLHSSELYGSELALLRVLAESLVRGLWLLQCADEGQLRKFKKGKLNKKMAELIAEIEGSIGTPNGVLSAFKKNAWPALNDFTHTGFHQVSRRHSPERVEGSYAEDELAKALGVAGALGLIAGAQIVGMSDRRELVSAFVEFMSKYANKEL
jgi:hypothetical protein